jgi:pimeloyl-ACP methyl ester carboxylesterase
VYALDLYGFGRTDAAQAGSTIDANGALLHAFLRLHGPAIVVGSSMGGTLAVRCAARAPELVDALVLVNPALPFPRSVPSARQVRNLIVFSVASVPLAGPWLVDTRARRIGATRVVDESLRASGVEPDSFDPEVRDALIDLTSTRYANGVAGRAYHEAVRTMLAYLATSMTADIDAVRAPTLVVHGRTDPLVPVDYAQAVARRRADWHLELLDCGHLPLFEAPDTLVDVVAAFLASTAPRRA